MPAKQPANEGSHCRFARIDLCRDIRFLLPYVCISICTPVHKCKETWSLIYRGTDFGQSYASKSLDKATDFYHSEIECVNTAASVAREMGAQGKWVLSVGATPTAHAATQIKDGQMDLHGELELLVSSSSARCSIFLGEREGLISFAATRDVIACATCNSSPPRSSRTKTYQSRSSLA